jgi:hypothetical protein
MEESGMNMPAFAPFFAPQRGVYRGINSHYLQQMDQTFLFKIFGEFGKLPMKGNERKERRAARKFKRNCLH